MNIPRPKLTPAVDPFAKDVQEVMLPVPVQQIDLLLLDGFSLVSIGGLKETLMIADHPLSKTRFKVRLVSLEGGAMTSSCGVEVSTEPLEFTGFSENLLILCGQPFGEKQRAEKNKLKSLLNRTIRHGGRVGALGPAVEFIASSKCAQSEELSVHWRSRPVLEETYDKQPISRRPFNISPKVLTAVGATAGIDLALSLIEETSGAEMARTCADELCYSAQYKFQKLNDDIDPIYSNLGHEKLRTAVAEMERLLEDSPSMDYYSDSLAMSQRQVERLFRRYLGTSPKRYFDKMRLNRARELILSTDMPISEIALASGFASVSHFSKKFRKRFDVGPLQVRRERRDLENQSL